MTSENCATMISGPRQPPTPAVYDARAEYDRAKAKLEHVSKALKDAERTLCYLVSERDHAEHMFNEAVWALTNETKAGENP